VSINRPTGSLDKDTCSIAKTNRTTRFSRQGHLFDSKNTTKRVRWLKATTNQGPWMKAMMIPPDRAENKLRRSNSTLRQPVRQGVNISTRMHSPKVRKSTQSFLQWQIFRSTRTTTPIKIETINLLYSNVQLSKKMFFSRSL
jgi:hypothetical protein